jgi:hypothetical protein
MDTLPRYNIPPSFEDEKEFERFVCDVFNDIHETNDFELYGRGGQDQDGIDIISIGKKIAIQCKLKKATHNSDNSKTSKELVKELIKDFDSFKSRFSTDEISEFHFAVDFLSDKNIQDECLKLEKSHAYTVRYWYWSRLIENSSEKTRLKYFKLFSDANSAYYLNRKPRSYNVDSNISYGKNLKNYLAETHQNFNYIPVHILIDTEVLVDITSRKNSYYENFAFNSNKKELLELFKNLEKKGEVNQFENSDLTTKEANNIISTLNKNSVYFITDGSTENYFELPKSDKICDCISCSIKNFNYKRAFDLETKLPESKLNEISYKGYFNFKLGRILESEKLFQRLYNNAIKDGNVVYLNIAKYNLNKLNNVFTLSKKRRDRDQFDLIKEYQPIENFVEDKTIKWLISDGFLTSAQFQLNHLKSKLISSYELVRNGGTTRNYHIQLAHNNYVQFNQFLTLNNIIFDSFLEDQQIKNDLIECFICALGIGIENSGMSGLNNYAVQIIIENSENESLQKLLKRYNVNQIVFEDYQESPHAKLEELYRNLFEHQADLYDILKNEDEAYFFKSKLNRFYSNALILLAYLDLSKTRFNKIFKLLLNCISGINLLNGQAIKYVGTIIWRKGKILNSPNLQKLFSLILKVEALHNREIISISFKLFNDRRTDLKINRTDFKNLKSQFLGKCEVCSKSHDEMDIVNMWHFATEFREEIGDLINERITGSSDSELQYISICEDILPYDEKIVDKLISNSISSSDPAIEKIFGIGNNINFYFLQLIHLVIKYGIDTQNEKFDKIRKLGDYYRWLLDPENYDYDIFYTDWLFNIYNIETLNKLKEIPEIKENLSTDLSENPNDKRLLQAFVRLYKG